MTYRPYTVRTFAIVAVVVSISCHFMGASRADDYNEAPMPIYRMGKADAEGTRYERGRDQEVCKTFLENLRYFARRNESLSCGQPVAPMLWDRLAKMEWEDLDPEQHPDLFKAVVTRTSPPLGDVAAEKKTLTRLADQVRTRLLVFRRARVELVGYPIFSNEEGIQTPERKFQIVQYGRNDSDPTNPFGCKPVRGAALATYAPSPAYFLVTVDMSQIFESLLIEFGGIEDPRNLWLIAGHVYGESYSNDGAVFLSELNLQKPIVLKPVCAYRFTESFNKRN